MDDNSSGSWLDRLSDLGLAATQAYGNIRGERPPSTAAAAPAPKNWYLIGGIGAAVLLVLVLVLGRK